MVLDFLIDEAGVRLPRHCQPRVRIWQDNHVFDWPLAQPKTLSPSRTNTVLTKFRPGRAAGGHTELLNARTGEGSLFTPTLDWFCAFRHGTRLAIGKTTGWIAVWERKTRNIIARLNRTAQIEICFHRRARPPGDAAETVLWNVVRSNVWFANQTGQETSGKSLIRPRRFHCPAGSDQTCASTRRLFRHGGLSYRGEVELAFSPDGTRIAPAADQSVRVEPGTANGREPRERILAVAHLFLRFPSHRSRRPRGGQGLACTGWHPGFCAHQCHAPLCI